LGDQCSNAAQQNNENAYWYLGKRECQRANAAFALYGVPVDAEKDSMCSRSTYINSFFTATGFDSYTRMVESVQGETVFSSTDSSQLSYLSNNNNGGNQNGYYSPGGLSSSCYSGGNNNNNNNNNNDGSSVSYAVGCNSRMFVSKTFTGAYCDGSGEVGETLSTFNTELDSVGCIEIYRSTFSDSSSAQNGNSNSATSLLAVSQACSIREYPSSCPDPYGTLSSYTSAMERATGVEVVGQSKAHRIRVIISWILFGLGVLFFILTLLACYVRARRTLRQRRLEKSSRIATQKATSQKSLSFNRSTSFLPRSSSRVGASTSPRRKDSFSKTVASIVSPPSSSNNGFWSKVKSAFRREKK
jgi:hypothetical protein